MKRQEKCISIEDLRKEFGLKPIRSKTKDQKKLKLQQDKFYSKHVCPVCGESLILIEGTNIMVCKNSECNEEESKKKYHTLDRVGAKIANKILV